MKLEITLGIDSATVGENISPENYTALVAAQVKPLAAEYYPNLYLEFDFLYDDNAETLIRWDDLHFPEYDRERITAWIQSAESDALSDPAAYGIA